MSARTFPRVTVVVPVRNGARWIGECLAALERQRYPEELLEVIVVDNGSIDQTADIVRGHRVRFLTESGIASPYAARNRGITEARGDILAFTDADCVPADDWVARGVEPIVRGDADLVGGEVRFRLGKKPSMAELLDATVNVEMRRNIQKNGVAKTANLFVHRRVFDALGLFPATVRSGGDVGWTGKATRAGFRLVYAEEAEVCKRPRALRALLSKQRRVGRGQVRVWWERGEGPVSVTLRALGSFLPRPPGKYLRMIEARGLRDVPRSTVRLWFVAWLATVATGIGRLESLMTPSSWNP